MLSREGFCKALRMIRDQESIDEQFSKALNLVGNGLKCTPCQGQF